jgi:hypothetical protein
MAIDKIQPDSRNPDNGGLPDTEHGFGTEIRGRKAPELGYSLALKTGYQPEAG